MEVAWEGSHGPHPEGHGGGEDGPVEGHEDDDVVGGPGEEPMEGLGDPEEGGLGEGGRDVVAEVVVEALALQEHQVGEEEEEVGQGEPLEVEVEAGLPLQDPPPGGRPGGRPEDVEGAEVPWDGGGVGPSLT